MERLFVLKDLDEIAASILERGAARPLTRLGWFSSERDAQLLHSFVFFLNVLDSKCRQRYALLKKRFLERLGRRIFVRLKR